MTVMRATVCCPSELGPGEVRQWHSFQDATPEFQHPFLSPELAQAAGAVHPGARVAVVEQDGRIVGFLPFTARRFGLALPVAERLVTSHAFVHAPDLTWSWDDVLGACGLAAFQASHLVAAQAGVSTGLRQATTPIIRVHRGWEAYLNAEGRGASKFFRTIAYKHRKLEREVGEVQLTTGSATQEELAQLAGWKSRQYRRSGWPDPFARPGTRELLDVLAAATGPYLAGVTTTLRAGGRLLSVDFSVRSRTIFACWFGSYDPACARYSPGAIRTLFMIEDAAASGVEYLDLCRGDEAYKDRLKTDEIPVAHGILARDTALGRLQRWQQAPRDALQTYILDHSRLRHAVRATLRAAGAARVSLRG